MSTAPAPVPCPLCGAAAERGAVYGADERPLSWRAGPPSWRNNLVSGAFSGTVVGASEFLAGSFATGVRCGTCRRIVLDA